MIRGGFNAGRPHLQGVLLFPDAARPTRTITTWFLVDTGADRSLVAPADYEKLGYGYADFRRFPEADSVGYGGHITAKTVPAKLLLRDESGAYVQLALEVEVVQPGRENELLPSILGRDVTDLFRLVVDRSVNLVALVDPEGDASPSIWPDERP
jgi:hypothetical protein